MEKSWIAKNILWVSALVMLLLLFLSESSNAQVTMVDPFEPSRADNVQARWVDDVLDTIVATVIVQGVNENSDPVGYQEDEVFIDAADWQLALEQYASQPANEEFRFELFTNSVFLFEDELVTNFLQFTSDPLDKADEFNEWFRDESQNFAPGASTMYLSVHEAGYSCSGFGTGWGSPPKSAVVFISTTEAFDPVIPYESASCSGTALSLSTPGFVSRLTYCSHGYLSAEEEDFCYPPTVAVAYERMAAEAAASVLPVTFDSDPAPTPIGGIQQQERSEVVLLTAQADTVADYATDYYESDAYEGYPTFLLYYGYFAGDPDAPEDEGDCEGEWCTGGGGSGGDGGDSAGIISAVDGVNETLLHGVGDGEFDIEVPTSQEMADQVTDALSELPCFACEFISEGNGIENTEVATQAEGLGEEFVSFFPDAGACAQMNMIDIPSMGLEFSVDTCNLDIVRFILELLTWGSTVVAGYYIIIGKKAAGSK